MAERQLYVLRKARARQQDGAGHQLRAQQQPPRAEEPRPREDRPIQKQEDVLSLLKRDHEDIQSLFEGFQTAGGDDRYFLASRIIRELERHGRLEEDLFYPVIRSRAEKQEHQRGDELVRTALKEHHILQKRIGQVKDVLAHDEGFTVQIDELMVQVQLHVEQEERELFPIARDLLSEAELLQVGNDMRRLRQEVDPSLAA